jgi:hypothetical protein
VIEGPGEATIDPLPGFDQVDITRVAPADSVIVARAGPNFLTIANTSTAPVTFVEANWRVTGAAFVEAQRPLPTSGPQIRALVVGISNWKDKDISPNQFAQSDAELVAQFLRSERAGSVSSVSVLVNEKATLAAIREQLAAVLFEAGRGDYVYIFLAGHSWISPGDKPLYLVPYDAVVQKPETTMISQTEILSMVERSAAARVIILADIGWDASKKVPSNVIVLAAGRRPGNVYEFDGYGVFTHALIDALNTKASPGKSGRISFSEVANYVNTWVSDRTAGRQRPFALGRTEGVTAVAGPDKPGIDLPPAKTTPIPRLR